MGQRHPNPRLIKIHRSYSVEEISDLLGIHKNTVRAWFKQGLPAIDQQRPTLVHGETLAEFLQKRRAKTKQRCGPGQIYCVRCRATQNPDGEMADYLPVTPTSGNLRGICPSCGGLIHRRVNLGKLDLVKGVLDISFPHGRQRIAESSIPSVNCDLA